MAEMHDELRRLYALARRGDMMMTLFSKSTAFVVAEEAARGLAEHEIYWVTGDNAGVPCQCEFAARLMNAARTHDYVEISRAVLRLYSEASTLYRDLNDGYRNWVESGECFLREIAPEIDPKLSGLYWGWRYSAVPDHLEHLGFFCTLLRQVLRDWPKLGEVDVFRGAELDDPAIELYRDYVGCWIQWHGFVSTSLSRRVAERFGNVLFVIHSKNRPLISDAAALSSEREVLFRDGELVLVEGVTIERGRVVIEVRDCNHFPEWSDPLNEAEQRELASGMLAR
jgi:hypothetical protein